MKVCSTCGQKKPRSAFYKQKGGAQGRRGRCKECYRAAQRAAWARDPKVQARRQEILKAVARRGVGHLALVDGRLKLNPGRGGMTLWFDLVLQRGAGAAPRFW
jgi:hypothetical protein